MCLNISKIDESIFFKINDDGVGFDLNIRKKGIGLQNMLSRVSECKGTFEINSSDFQ